MGLCTGALGLSTCCVPPAITWAFTYLSALLRAALARCLHATRPYTPYLHACGRGATLAIVTRLREKHSWLGHFFNHQLLNASAAAAR